MHQRFPTLLRSADALRECLKGVDHLRLGRQPREGQIEAMERFETALVVAEEVLDDGEAAALESLEEPERDSGGGAGQGPHETAPEEPSEPATPEPRAEPEVPTPVVEAPTTRAEEPSEPA